MCVSKTTGKELRPPIRVIRTLHIPTARIVMFLVFTAAEGLLSGEAGIVVRFGGVRSRDRSIDTLGILGRRKVPARRRTPKRRACGTGNASTAPASAPAGDRSSLGVARETSAPRGRCWAWRGGTRPAWIRTGNVRHAAMRCRRGV